MASQALHGRQRQLLALLRSQQRMITSKELAAQMEVSDRTVRNDVQILNSVLERYGARIEAVRGKGLCLRSEDNAAPLINSLLHTDGALQTRDERADFLLVKLLLSDRELQLGELEDEMFISRTTLESDIRYVRKIITSRRPHLQLNRGGNRISIVAPEWRKRLMLTKIFAERWDYHTKEGVQLQGSPLDAELFQIIFNLTKSAVREHGIKLDDYDLIALVFTVAVAEFRIRTGHPLDAPVADTSDIPSAQVVEQLIDSVEELSQTLFGEDERKSILLSFSFRQSLVKNPENQREIMSKLDQRALRCASMFLHHIRAEYGVDFSEDELLYADLALHIFRLEKRLRYSYERKNVILSTIKTRYIYFFELAMTIRECFQAVYGMTLSEDEWGYFADSLITAVDREAKRRYPNGIPTVFVSHLGRSDREMLSSELKALYGNTLDLRGPFSIYERDKIRDAKPELILSTVRLETVRAELAYIPHVTFSSTLDDDTFSHLQLHIKDIHERLFFKPLPQAPVRYFDPDLFFTGLDMSSDMEVVDFLANRLVDQGYATIEGVSRALEREEWSSTSMENGIALPRLRVLGPFQTVIAVAQLRRPVHWGSQKVSTAFFLSVSEEDLPIFGTLLNYLANHLCRRQNVKKLLQMQSFEDLRALL